MHSGAESDKKSIQGKAALHLMAGFRAFQAPASFSSSRRLSVHAA
jgi:hypothetical protein